MFALFVYNHHKALWQKCNSIFPLFVGDYRPIKAYKFWNILLCGSNRSLHFSVRSFGCALFSLYVYAPQERKNKMKLRKFMSVLLTLAMALTAMAAFAVSASAEAIGDLKALKSGEQTTLVLPSFFDDQSYKIVLSKSGKLNIAVSSLMKCVSFKITDTNNESFKPDTVTDKLGRSSYDSVDGIRLFMNDTEKKYTGSLKYSLEKGTYYIRVRHYDTGAGTKVTFKATYPSADSSSDVKITNFTMTMKVGDTLQLGADLSAKSDDNVTWKSSKTSVAKVSATGKITAQAKGTATITASIGSSKMQIKVKVTA